MREYGARDLTRVVETGILMIGGWGKVLIAVLALYWLLVGHTGCGGCRVLQVLEASSRCN